MLMVHLVFKRSRFVSGRARRAFTLVEILIVVVILGILAAIISPQFANTALESQLTQAKSQLYIVRSQIELHDARWISDRFDPLTNNNQWEQLVSRRYISESPQNALQGNSTTVADAAAPGIAWVWIPNANGGGMIYAVDGEGAVLDW